MENEYWDDEDWYGYEDEPYVMPVFEVTDTPAYDNSYDDFIPFYLSEDEFYSLYDIPMEDDFDYDAAVMMEEAIIGGLSSQMPGTWQHVGGQVYMDEKGNVYDANTGEMGRMAPQYGSSTGGGRGVGQPAPSRGGSAGGSSGGGSGSFGGGSMGGSSSKPTSQSDPLASILNSLLRGVTTGMQPTSRQPTTLATSRVPSAVTPFQGGQSNISQTLGSPVVIISAIAAATALGVMLIRKR